MNSPSAQAGTLSESEGQPPNPTTAPHPDVYLEASPDPHIQSHQPAMSIASMAYNQSTVLPPNSKVAPYSVNGISLSSPNVDMMHPAMGYPGELTNISLSPYYRILGILRSKTFRRNPLLTVSCIYFFLTTWHVHGLLENFTRMLKIVCLFFALGVLKSIGYRYFSCC